jgi:hypothetical protein
MKGRDSEQLLRTFMGQDHQGRTALILEATGRTALRKGEWVLIPPHDGPALSREVNIELGNAPEYQLYDLSADLGEQDNQATRQPDQLKDMIVTYEEIMGAGRAVSGGLDLK